MRPKFVTKHKVFLEFLIKYIFSRRSFANILNDLTLLSVIRHERLPRNKMYQFAWVIFKFRFRVWWFEKLLFWLIQRLVCEWFKKGHAKKWNFQRFSKRWNYFQKCFSIKLTSYRARLISAHWASKTPQTPACW